MQIVALLTLILVHVWPARGLRVLSIFPVACPSHQTVFSSLTHELLRQGHELVVLTPFPALHQPRSNIAHHQPHSNVTQHQARSNLTIIDLMRAVGNYHEQVMQMDLYFYDKPIYYPFFYWLKAPRYLELIFNDPNVRSLLYDRRGFDLVICEDILTEALCGFAEYFKVHFLVMAHASVSINLFYVPFHYKIYSTPLETTVNPIFTGSQSHHVVPGRLSHDQQLRGEPPGAIPRA